MLDRLDETIVAISSAPGAAPVGIVRLSGERALEIADQMARLGGGELLRERRTTSAAELAARSAGRVHVEAVTQLEISSTDLRASIRRGVDPRFLMPEAVRQIIIETECYAETA